MSRSKLIFIQILKTKLNSLEMVVLATTTRPSSHLGLKVMTFLNSPGNVDFENALILILTSIFAAKKLKQYVTFIMSQLIVDINV